MEVSFQLREQRLDVLLIGELDHHTAKGIGNRIDFEIYLQKPKIVCIDFKSLTFMDSSGLAVVMGRRKVCREIGAVLSVCNLHGSIRKVLLMSGIQKYVNVEEMKYESI